MIILLYNTYCYILFLENSYLLTQGEARFLRVYHMAWLYYGPFWSNISESSMEAVTPHFVSSLSEIEVGAKHA